MHSPKVESTLNRRSFFKSTAVGAAALAIPGFALFDSAKPAFAGSAPTLTPGDVAVLKFLAAAELVETDLWGQYSELANDNPEFRRALQQIKHTLPDYVTGDFNDERSHASFINPFLTAAGQQPVDLDRFG